MNSEGPTYLISFRLLASWLNKEHLVPTVPTYLHSVRIYQVLLMQYLLVDHTHFMTKFPRNTMFTKRYSHNSKSPVNPFNIVVVEKRTESHQSKKQLFYFKLFCLRTQKMHPSQNKFIYSVKSQTMWASNAHDSIQAEIMQQLNTLAEVHPQTKLRCNN